MSWVGTFTLNSQQLYVQNAVTNMGVPTNLVVNGLLTLDGTNYFTIPQTLRSYQPIWMRPQQPHAVFLNAA